MTAGERVAALFDGDAGDVYRAETATRAEVERLVAEAVAGERARCAAVVKKERVERADLEGRDWEGLLSLLDELVDAIQSGEGSS